MHFKSARMKKSTQPEQKIGVSGSIQISNTGAVKYQYRRYRSCIYLLLFGRIVPNFAVSHTPRAETASSIIGFALQQYGAKSCISCVPQVVSSVSGV